MGEEGEKHVPPEEIQAVAIKMPDFMETAASAWFQIMEANFKLKRITIGETKFFHVVASLPPALIARLPPQILETQDYSEIRTAVIAMHERTKPELFSKLIAKTTMSGRPSSYLQELNEIAVKVGVSDDLVRHQFIQALPNTISIVLAAQKDLTLTQLGKLADELSPLFQNSAMAVNNYSNYMSASHEHVERAPHSNNYRYENNSDFIPLGIRPFGAVQKPRICRGHLYFAERSKTCKPWCKFPGNKSKYSMQPSSRHVSPARSRSSSRMQSPGRRYSSGEYNDSKESTHSEN